MTTIRSIVAATDFSGGSEVAVERAVQLATQHGASLRLLHAFDASALHSLKGLFDPQHMTMNPPADVRMRKRLSDQAVALAARTGLMVDAQFSIGSASEAIHAYMAAHEPSLVVLASRTDPTHSGLGSTALKVLRAPSCPVLVVRSADARAYDKVLSAVDMREGSMRAARLAISLFPAAHHHLLYAVELTLDPLKTRDLVGEQISLLLDSLHAQASLDLQQLAQDFSQLTVHPVAVDVAEDLPFRAIVVRAVDLPADCIVVGHHGDGSGSKNELGSMAQHVLHHSLRDVLVVP